MDQAGKSQELDITQKPRGKGRKVSGQHIRTGSLF